MSADNQCAATSNMKGYERRENQYDGCPTTRNNELCTNRSTQHKGGVNEATNSHQRDSSGVSFRNYVSKL